MPRVGLPPALAAWGLVSLGSELSPTKWGGCSDRVCGEVPGELMSPSQDEDRPTGPLVVAAGELSPPSQDDVIPVAAPGATAATRPIPPPAAIRGATWAPEPNAASPTALEPWAPAAGTAVIGAVTELRQHPNAPDMTEAEPDSLSNATARMIRPVARSCSGASAAVNAEVALPICSRAPPAGALPSTYTALAWADTDASSCAAAPTADAKDRNSSGSTEMSCIEVAFYCLAVGLVGGHAPVDVLTGGLQRGLEPLQRRLELLGPLRTQRVGGRTFPDSVGDPAAAATHLGHAIGLWRGEVVADLFREPFWDTIAPVWRERRLAAAEELFDAQLQLGQHDATIDQIAAEAAANPLRERMSGQLMLALYRAGRQSEALAVYRRTKALLAEELGVDPGRALAALELGILQQDPALDAPPPVLATRVSLGTVTNPAAELETSGSWRLGSAVAWLGSCVGPPGAGLDLKDCDLVLTAWRNQLVELGQDTPAVDIQVIDAHTVVARVGGNDHVATAIALRDTSCALDAGDSASARVHQRSAVAYGWLPSVGARLYLEPVMVRALSAAAGSRDEGAARTDPPELTIAFWSDPSVAPFGETTIATTRLEWIAGSLASLPAVERDMLELATVLGDAARPDILAKLTGVDPAPGLRALSRCEIGRIVLGSDSPPAARAEAIAVVLAAMSDERRVERTRAASVALSATSRKSTRVVELLEAAILIEAATGRRPGIEHAGLAAEELSLWAWECWSRGDDARGSALLARAVLVALLGRPSGHAGEVAAEAIAVGAVAAHAGQLMERFATGTDPFRRGGVSVTPPWLETSITESVARRLATAGASTTVAAGDRARLG